MNKKLINKAKNSFCWLLILTSLLSLLLTVSTTQVSSYSGSQSVFVCCKSSTFDIWGLTSPISNSIYTTYSCSIRSISSFGSTGSINSALEKRAGISVCTVSISVWSPIRAFCSCSSRSILSLIYFRISFLLSSHLTLDG